MIGGFIGFFCAAVFLILPMSCIWFPKEVGAYTGAFMFRSYINITTPAYVTSIIGWLFLLIPILGNIYDTLKL